MPPNSLPPSPGPVVVLSGGGTQTHGAEVRYQFAGQNALKTWCLQDQHELP